MFCDRVETFSQIRGASKVGKGGILIGTPTQDGTIDRQQYSQCFCN